MEKVSRYEETSRSGPILKLSRYRITIAAGLEGRICFSEINLTLEEKMTPKRNLIKRFTGIGRMASKIDEPHTWHSATGLDMNNCIKAADRPAD